MNRFVCLQKRDHFWGWAKSGCDQKQIRAFFSSVYFWYEVSKNLNLLIVFPKLKLGLFPEATKKFLCTKSSPSQSRLLRIISEWEISHLLRNDSKHHKNVLNHIETQRKNYLQRWTTSKLSSFPKKRQ